MLEREADKSTRGGILADEMGMGKTLQTISLILAGLSQCCFRAHLSGQVKWRALPWWCARLRRCSSGATRSCALLIQVGNCSRVYRVHRDLYIRSLNKRSPKRSLEESGDASGSLEVRLFYGTEKKEALSGLNGLRVVVLTTYQTLESDYRQQVNFTKVQCPFCGRLFQKSKLFYHQKYFCGPDAQRTEKQAKAQRKADYKETFEIQFEIQFEFALKIFKDT